ncbi:heterokaryon incompatibility protein-domain-containing protein [Xylaria castorea]|nr:heterokaryon incompatibility protein-domain-containing protein [Xylaria castorea]
MEYQPLDASKWETRFLKQLPSSNTGILRFEVVIHSLNHPPAYCAVSYCWGNELQQALIEIDGSFVHITENLAAALRHAGTAPGELLWADAVCIDQMNHVEKAYQVGMLMGLIYSKSQMTIAWLGHSAQYTCPAYDFLNSLNESNIHNETISSRGFLYALRHRDFPTHALGGLYDLLARPYWKRVWIIQEIAKARYVKIICGHLCFELEPLIAVTQHLKDLSQPDRCVIDSIAWFRNIELSLNTGRGTRMSLLDALIASRYSQATDRRDKVYALRGLSRDGQDLVPTPSYVEPVQEVFRSLSLAFLQSSQRWATLLLASRAPLWCGEHTESWAVDWSSLAFNVPPWLTSEQATMITGGYYKDQAGSLSRPGSLINEPAVSCSSVTRGFVTPGRLIGTITDVSNDWASQSDLKVSLSTEYGEEYGYEYLRCICLDIFHKMAKEVARKETMPENELTGAFLRIILGDSQIDPWSSQRNDLVEDAARQLGCLKVFGYPIQYWAQGCAMKMSKYQEADAPNSLSSLPRTPTEKSAGTAKKFGNPKTSVSRKHKKRASAHNSKNMKGKLIDDFAESAQIPSPQPSPDAFGVWAAIFSAMDLSPEFGLCFATAEIDEDVHVLQVHRDTKVGDTLCCLDQCYLPVVVRGLWPSRIVGEACISRKPDGQWYSGDEYLASRDQETMEALTFELP